MLSGSTSAVQINQRSPDRYIRRLSHVMLLRLFPDYWMLSYSSKQTCISPSQPVIRLQYDLLAHVAPSVCLGHIPLPEQALLQLAYQPPLAPFRPSLARPRSLQ